MKLREKIISSLFLLSDSKLTYRISIIFHAVIYFIFMLKIHKVEDWKLWSLRGISESFMCSDLKALLLKEISFLSFIATPLILSRNFKINVDVPSGVLHHYYFKKGEKNSFLDNFTYIKVIQSVNPEMK